VQGSKFSPGQPVSGQGLPYWANAGVLMLVRIGADQTTAAPTPIRLSTLRREMPSLGSSSSGVSCQPSLTVRGHTVPTPANGASSSRRTFPPAALTLIECAGKLPYRPSSGRLFMMGANTP